MDGKVFFGRALTVTAYAILAAYTLVALWKLARRLKACISNRSKVDDPELEAPEWSGIDVDATNNVQAAEEASRVKEARMKSETVEVFTQLRLDNCRMLYQYINRLSFVFIVFVVLSRHSGGIWAPDYEGQDFAGDQMSIGLLLFFGSLLFSVVPQRFSLTIVNFLHVVTMLFITGKTLASNTAHLLVFRTQSFTSMRMGASFVNGSCFWTVVLNFCFSAVSSWTYVSLAQHDVGIDDDFPTEHRIWFVVSEILTTVLISLVSYGVEARGLAVSRARVQEKLSSQAASTINVLLTALCDAVVNLSPDFNVLFGAEKLCALLVTTPCTISSFLDALAESDRNKFLEACNSFEHGDSFIAPSLHVGMRGAYGIIVKTQLFITRLPVLGGRYEYILGVRELSREEDDELARADDPKCDETEQVLVSALQHPYPSSAPSDSSTSTQSGNSSHRPFVPMVASDAGELAFCFDTMTGIISSATPAFIAIGGPSTIGANISHWVKHGRAFHAFAQELGNTTTYEALSPPSADFGLLRLQPPVAVRAHLEYRARCALELMMHEETKDLDETEESGDGDVACMVRAVLTDLSQRRCKESATRPSRALPEFRGQYRNRTRSTGGAQSTIAL